MTDMLIIIAWIGVTGLAIQLVVLWLAVRGIRVRTECWFDDARSGRFRRQTRTAAIAELERRLLLLPSAVSLRKLGVMAPLVGVILTAASIVYGKAAVSLDAAWADAGGMNALLSGLAPLLAGVAVGAMLAIVNQILLMLLHLVEDRRLAGVLHRTSDDWFRESDDRVDLVADRITEAGRALEEATRQLEQITQTSAQALERLVGSVAGATTQLESVATMLQKATEVPARAFAQSASELTDSARAVGSDFRRLAGTLESLHQEGLERLQPIQARQMDALQLQMSLTQELAATLRRLGDAPMGDLDARLRSAAESTQRLREGMDQLAVFLGGGELRIQEQIDRSCATIRVAFDRLQGVLSEVESTWRGGAARFAQAAPSPEEATRIRETMRALADLLASALSDVREVVLMPEPQSSPRPSGFFGTRP